MLMSCGKKTQQNPETDKEKNPDERNRQNKNHMLIN